MTESKNKQGKEFAPKFDDVLKKLLNTPPQKNKGKQKDKKKS